MSSGTSQDQYGDWYEIRIQGRLDDRWSTWLNGFDLSHTDDGATVLRGPVIDQAALHGLLHKIRDIGLPLLSVTRTRTRRPDPPSIRPHQHPPNQHRRLR